MRREIFVSENEKKTGKVGKKRRSERERERENEREREWREKKIGGRE